jgi:carbon-monoxide dehydrogenase iron sulfur subunit
MDKGKAKSWYVLKVAPEKCVGCQLCEQVCSLKHEKEISCKKANISVCFGASRHYPVTCGQCLDAPCENICPRRAIYRDQRLGYLKIDKWGCNLCGLCFGACPFGMIRPGLKIVLKCDLCGGEPECADICPTGAISYVRRSETRLDVEWAGVV